MTALSTSPQAATNRAPRRVLVTGAAGLIGSATTKYLTDRGISVSALSLSGPFPASADRTFEADARSPEALDAALADVDAIVHLAAIPHPQLALAVVVFSTNVVSTFNVLEQAGRNGVSRVVLASSINAFGVPLNQHRPWPAYFPLDESLPADIADPYSLSKQVDEMTMRMAYRRWGTKILALRFPNVDTEAEQLRLAADTADDPDSMVREGWAYLDIRDATRAIRAALTVPLTGPEVVGLSAADTLIDKPTEAMLARYAPGVPIRRRLPGNAAAVDTHQARKLLGFEPEHSIHTHPRVHGESPAVARGE